LERLGLILYLLALAVSLLGMGLIDFKHKLALFVQPLRTLVTLATSVVMFLIWDLVGIAQGIFFRGSGPYLTGITIAPELPIEEVFFLTLLSYTILIAYLGFAKWRKS
jgi:lycopene cyclase domain-containing protein